LAEVLLFNLMMISQIFRMKEKELKQQVEE